ncbi:MAG TPA: MnhB domain-containing protein [Alkalispirochaeta sp.]|nr:MnhB domain-containing protein [Alkalispirochaeta sp.]
MRKTDILDVVARKLSPYMFLFGVYLVSFGDSSPGGGFQGGVVIASGIILLAMARGPARAEELFPSGRLSMVETTAFIALLLTGTAGIVFSGAFLAGFLGGSGVRFVFLLNMLIGLKVAAGVSLICLTIFREE